jgi:hypothetical protein
MAREEYVEILRRYKNSNATKYGIEKIGIFGSVARGEEKSESDVDVCVELSKPDLFYMVHIKEDLQELFGKPVDVVRMRPRMNSVLRRNIERDTVYA